MRKLSLLFGVLVVAFCTQRATSQTTVVYDPVIVPMSPVVAPPVVYETYRPIVSAPVVTNYRRVVRYAAPATSYRPVTVYDPVVDDAPPLPAASYPITAYRPVVTSYRTVYTDDAPVIYDPPVVTTYYAPVVYPRVFVAGQPVRNFFRAITP
jgi:hypothetical protein